MGRSVLGLAGMGSHTNYRNAQISDLHLSMFHEQSRQTDFKDFCVNTLPIIGPPLTLVTGDLTDAKDRDLVFSEQVLHRM